MGGLNLVHMLILAVVILVPIAIVDNLLRPRKK